MEVQVSIYLFEILEFRPDPGVSAVRVPQNQKVTYQISVQRRPIYRALKIQSLRNNRD